MKLKASPKKNFLKKMTNNFTANELFPARLSWANT